MDNVTTGHINYVIISGPSDLATPHSFCACICMLAVQHIFHGRYDVKPPKRYALRRKKHYPPGNHHASHF